MSQSTMQRKRGDTNEFLIRPAESASIVVVQAIAIVTGQSHEEMQPLAEVIDPDALDRIVSDSTCAAQVNFEYEECQVVAADDRIVVTEPSAGN